MNARDEQFCITLREWLGRIERGDVPTWWKNQTAEVVAKQNLLLAKLDAHKDFLLCKECGATPADFFAFEAHVRAAHRKEPSGKPLLSLVVK